MKYFFLLISLIVINFSYALAQNDSSPINYYLKEIVWEYPENNYINSYGSVFDLLAFEDHYVVREVFEIKPSLLALINSIDGFEKSNKIIMHLEIKVIKNSYKIFLKKIQLKNNMDTIIISNEFEEVVRNKLLELDLQALKNTHQTYKCGLFISRKK